jgi:hypothetical protein
MLKINFPPSSLELSSSCQMHDTVKYMEVVKLVINDYHHS